MYWMIVFTDDYGEHVNIDVSEEYARRLRASRGSISKIKGEGLRPPLPYLIGGRTSAH